MFRQNPEIQDGGVLVRERGGVLIYTPTLNYKRRKKRYYVAIKSHCFYRLTETLTRKLLGQIYPLAGLGVGKFTTGTSSCLMMWNVLDSQVVKHQKSLEYISNSVNNQIQRVGVNIINLRSFYVHNLRKIWFPHQLPIRYKRFTLLKRYSQIFPAERRPKTKERKK